MATKREAQEAGRFRGVSYASDAFTPIPHPTTSATFLKGLWENDAAIRVRYSISDWGAREWAEHPKRLIDDFPYPAYPQTKRGRALKESHIRFFEEAAERLYWKKLELDATFRLAGNVRERGRKIRQVVESWVLRDT